jgi:hypothetical protein
MNFLIYVCLLFVVCYPLFFPCSFLTSEKLRTGRLAFARPSDLWMANNSENVKAMLENHVKNKRKDPKRPETWYPLSWSDFSSLKVCFLSSCCQNRDFPFWVLAKWNMFS